MNNKQIMSSINVDKLSSKNIVQHLFQVISRELPMSTANFLLDENLCSYMDNKKMGSNRETWFRWVQFLHKTADKKMSSLSIVIDKFKKKKDTVEAEVHWKAQLNGQTVVSDVKKVVYQLKNNKIINIWTHRSNYIFIYGNKIATSKLYFYWIAVKLSLWSLIKHK